MALPLPGTPKPLSLFAFFTGQPLHLYFIQSCSHLLHSPNQASPLQVPPKIFLHQVSLKSSSLQDGGKQGFRNSLTFAEPCRRVGA